MNSKLKVIQPSGILDSSGASQVSDLIAEALKQDSFIILLDLKNVVFIDSSGLGGLVNSFNLVRSRGGRLILCSLCEQARMLLEITGIDQIFEIYPNRTEFSKTLLGAV